MATCELMLMDHTDAGDIDCRLNPKHRKALQARQLARAGQWRVVPDGHDGDAYRERVVHQVAGDPLLPPLQGRRGIERPDRGDRFHG